MTQLEKDQHIEKMHSPQDKNDRTRFHTQLLDQLPRIIDSEFNSQRVHGITQVDQVKAYQQQVVNGLCKLLIAMEDVDQKDLPVPEKGAGYPDGEDDRDGQINAVKREYVSHNDSFKNDETVRYFIVLNFQ
jgi:hypothetical protein